MNLLTAACSNFDKILMLTYTPRYESYKNMKKPKSATKPRKNTKKPTQLTRLGRLLRSRITIIVIFATLMGAIGAYQVFFADAADNSIRIATYNILGSNHVETGKKLGTVNQRADRATDIIKGKAGPEAFDIVGVQEMQPDQYAIFKQKLPKYSTFPKNKSSQKTIFWRTNRFTKLESGYVKYPFYGDKNLETGGNAPWVKLRDNQTKEVFYVLNHHPVSWNNDPGSDKGGAQKREKTAEIIAKWAESKNAPVFVTGDMNSTGKLRNYPTNYAKRPKDEALGGKRDRLPYCIMTRSSDLRNSYDKARDNKGKCPSKNIDEIDAIYVTNKKIHVKRWHLVDNNTSRKVSDHMPIYIDAVIKPSDADKPAQSVSPTEVAPPVSNDEDVAVPDSAPTSND